LDQFLKTSGLADSLQVLPTLSPDELAGLYRACKGLFHPAPLSVWEGPLRYALSCARPIITAQSPLVDALLGPAAYSLPEKDFRGMGAAMITIAIEEEVEESLSRSARERSAKWDLGLFKQKLALNYKALRT
jgi:glycosyltransferase involved in cell wall biosynthesis